MRQEGIEMSKGLLSEKDIEKLKNNKYVKVETQ